MNTDELKALSLYFKVGISADYILVADDFPVDKVPPGRFVELLEMMFQHNDEVINGRS